MGLFKGLFSKHNEEESIAQYAEGQYRQLITFINFAKKVNPQAGGNYGIEISYNTPENHTISNLYATFGFYDFDNIYVAHEFAVNSDMKMVEFMYHKISEEAGLTRLDWPYGIYACDFVDVLRGTHSCFTLIPDKSNDDIFTFKAKVGMDHRTTVQVLNTVKGLLKAYFPELTIESNTSSLYSMHIRVRI